MRGKGRDGHLALPEVPGPRHLAPPPRAVALRALLAERERIAMQYRSEGDEAAKEIRATADKQRKVILADAYEKAQIIRGKADAQTTQIYAKAHKQDPAFFAFMRSLQAYRDSIGKDTRLVITPDSEFFEFFEHSGVASGKK